MNPDLLALCEALMRVVACMDCNADVTIVRQQGRVHPFVRHDWTCPVFQEFRASNEHTQALLQAEQASEHAAQIDEQVKRAQQEGGSDAPR